MLYDYILKFVMIGDKNTGKSSICHKLTNNFFDENMEPTIGVEFYSIIIPILDKNIKCQLWDTSGDQRFAQITKSYYKDVVGIVLVFDLSDKQSFNNLELWIKDIKKYTLQTIRVLVMGNKFDKTRAISKSKIKKYMKSNKLNYIETSAITGQNIYKGFENIVYDILENIPNFDHHSGIIKKQIEIKKKPFSLWDYCYCFSKRNYLF